MMQPSSFAKIIKEIDADEVPPEYIERISVSFHDGSKIDLTGESVTNPIPIADKGNWRELEEAYKKLSEVKVYIDAFKLEQDVNVKVEEYLGKFC